MRIVLMVHLLDLGIGPLLARLVKDYERAAPPPPGAEITEAIWGDDMKEPVRTIYSPEDDTLVYYFDVFAAHDDMYALKTTKAYLAAGWEAMDDLSLGYRMPHPRGYVSPKAAADAEWALIAPTLST